MTGKGARPDAQSQIQGLVFATMLVDPDMLVIEANHAAEEMLGKSAVRIIGANLSESVSFEEGRIAKRLSQLDGQVIARGTPLVIGERVIQADISVSPLPSHPGWRVVTMTHSGQDDMAEGSQGDAAVGTPAILAHEIKNPLAAIRGAGQLLARGTGEKERKLTGVILDEVDRIARLVDRMQKLGSATSEPLEPVNLHQVIRSACQTVRTGSEGSFRLEEEFDPSIPPVLASSDALKQVLVNLLANAREASMGEDEPLVVVRTRFVSGLIISAIRLGRPVKLPVEIQIIDNGKGIDPAIESRVFEPFVSGKQGGQGLGLALVKKLVNDMQGRVSHERDRTLEMTHFRINLPIVEAQK